MASQQTEPQSSSKSTSRSSRTASGRGHHSSIRSLETSVGGKDCRLPKLALTIQVCLFAAYSYVLFVRLCIPSSCVKWRALVPKALTPFGMWQYLTFQCLIVQLLSSILHIVSFFTERTRRLRDLLFSTLAFPLSAMVTTTFWIVWLALGRESIYPKAADSLLGGMHVNHIMHSLIFPANVLTTLLVYHKPSHLLVFRDSRVGIGHIASFAFPAAYMSLLCYIYARTHLFPYPFLNKLAPSRALFTIFGVMATSPIWYELCKRTTFFFWRSTLTRRGIEHRRAMAVRTSRSSSESSAPSSRELTPIADQVTQLFGGKILNDISKKAPADSDAANFETKRAAKPKSDSSSAAKNLRSRAKAKG